jgi:hypothetical protein
MRFSTVLVCVAVGLGGSSCKGTFEAIDLPRDLTVVVITNDMSGGGGNDGMSGTAVKFSGAAPSIEADITAAGCAVSECHVITTAGMMSAGTPLNLIATPTAQSDIDANYASFKALTTTSDPTMSLVLVYATGGPGGTGHSGGQVITTGDEVYNRWVAWIGGGEPE